MPNTLQEQLVKHLTDVHSIEEQAIVQMRRARRIAGDPKLAHIFELHLGETEVQEERVRNRLKVLGADPPGSRTRPGRQVASG